MSRDSTKKPSTLGSGAMSGSSLRLHVSNLTRNVRAEHLEEVFGHFGKVTSVSLAVDGRVGLSKGYGYVEFASHDEAQTAQRCLDDGALDGNQLKVTFVVAGRSQPPARADDAKQSQRYRRADTPPRRYRPQPRVYRRVAYSRSRSPRPDRRRRLSRSDSSDFSSSSYDSRSEYSSSGSSRSYSSRSSSVSSSPGSSR